MGFIEGFATRLVPGTDPDREMQEVLRLLNITRAGSALVAQYAQEATKRDPMIADKVRKGYQK